MPGAEVPLCSSHLLRLCRSLDVPHVGFETMMSVPASGHTTWRSAGGRGTQLSVDCGSSRIIDDVLLRFRQLRM
jgi:hypothetical protein